MEKINQSSLKAKIVQFLMSHHPVTTKQLQTELNLKENSLYLELNRLQKQGVVRLEPAGPDIFVTLVTVAGFFGRKRQRRALKRKRPKRAKRPLAKRIRKRIYG